MNLANVTLLAQDDPSSMVPIVLIMGLGLLMIIGMWKMFIKAGEPGWASIIPLYNGIVMCRIAGKPEWWFLLFFVPFVGIVVSIIVAAGVAENFGKGTGFVIGLIFLPFIFYPILGFGDAQYGQSPQASY